jgi:hypothetical protein
MLSITGLIALITGLAGPIASVIAKVTDLKLAQVQATTDVESLHIAAQIDEAHDRLMILQAEAGSRLNSIIRGLLAFGPMIYLNKVFVWDKVIGSLWGQSCVKGVCSVFNTDALDSNLWTVVTVVLSFYFLYDIAASWRKK